MSSSSAAIRLSLRRLLAIAAGIASLTACAGDDGAGGTRGAGGSGAGTTSTTSGGDGGGGNTTSTTSTGSGAPCGPDPVQAVDGSFLFTLSLNVSKSKPVVFSAEVTTSGSGLSMVVQPLQFADRKTPTGTTYDVGPFPIEAADGLFHVVLPELLVPGDANPVTKGSSIWMSLTLEGWACADLLCGRADGTATTESGLDINLDNSTFTLDRAAADGSYTEPPQINCAGGLALPVDQI